jgi:hypothetical protein
LLAYHIDFLNFVKSFYIKNVFYPEIIVPSSSQATALKIAHSLNKLTIFNFKLFDLAKAIAAKSITFKSFSKTSA